MAGKVLSLGQSGRRRTAFALGSIVVIVAVWQVLVAAEVTSSVVLPPPADVLDALVEYRAPILDATLVTLGEVLLGFAGAIVLGGALALGLTYSRIFNATVYPPLLILHAIPKTAIAPLLLIWFGFGLAPKVVLSVTLAFFPILISTIAGLRSVDPDLHELARSLRSPWLRTFRMIDLPHSLPTVFAGLRASIHLAVTGAVIAEFISGGDGLAFLLNSASAHFQIELAFAVAIAISVLSATLFGAVVLVEKLVVPWSGD